jgi:hypothetical protein
MKFSCVLPYVPSYTLSPLILTRLLAELMPHLVPKHLKNSLAHLNCFLTDIFCLAMDFGLVPFIQASPNMPALHHPLLMLSLCLKYNSFRTWPQNRLQDALSNTEGNTCYVTFKLQQHISMLMLFFPMQLLCKIVSVINLYNR